MSEKNFTTRIVHKHDIEENWLKATNFIPKKGEIIIYDKDASHDYARVKIGDGVTGVNALEFIDDNVISKLPEQVQADWNQNDSDAKDYIKNRPFYAEDNGWEVVETYSNDSLEATTAPQTYIHTINGWDFFDLDNLPKVNVTINGSVYSGLFADFGTGYCEATLGDGYSISYDLPENVFGFSGLIGGNTYNIQIEFLCHNLTYHKIPAEYLQTLEHTHTAHDIDYGVISIEHGGTDADNTEDARTNLGVYSKEEVDNTFNTLVGDTSVSVQITNAISDKADISAGQHIVTSTSSDGIAFTATVPGITALTAGISFIMVPDRASASKTPTLNVNGLGAKGLKRRLSSGATAYEGYTTTWITQNKPFRVMYDGTQWIVEGHNKPVAADIYGPITATNDVDGNAIVDTYATKAELSSMLPKVTTISLPVANWTGSAEPYSQVVTIGYVTNNSKIDLQPTATQVIELQNSETALMAENNNGVVTVYALGGKPEVNFTMQAMITEVVVV